MYICMCVYEERERERESAPAADQATNHVERRFNDADVHPH